MCLLCILFILYEIKLQQILNYLLFKIHKEKMIFDTNKSVVCRFQTVFTKILSARNTSAQWKRTNPLTIENRQIKQKHATLVDKALGALGGTFNT